MGRRKLFIPTAVIFSGVTEDLDENQEPENKIQQDREFPGGPVVRTRCFHCQGPGLVPGRGTKIPRAVRRSQKKKKIQQDNVPRV